jgi:hypothetical protein
MSSGGIGLDGSSANWNASDDGKPRNSLYSSSLGSFLELAAALLVAWSVIGIIVVVNHLLTGL